MMPRISAPQARDEDRRPPAGRDRSLPLGAAVVLVPGVLVAALSLFSGGFFPGAVGAATAALLLLLVARLTVAREPLEGVGPAVVLVGAALAGFAAWTLVSASWSGSSSRAVVEYQRVLLYLTVFALIGSVGRTDGRAALLVRGLAAGAAAVGVAALAVWLLPDVFRVDRAFGGDRLNWPTSYWNTTALLAALGAVWCLHLTAAPRERRPVRLLGAAAVPPLAAVVLFASSRGAAAAGIVAVLAYVLLARSRGLVTALVATVPPTVAGLVLTADLDPIALERPSTAALASGQDAALTLAVCALVAAALRWALLALVDGRIAAVRGPSPRARRAGAAVAACVVVVGAVAAGAPGRVADAVDEFSSPADVVVTDDRAGRFTELGNNGRLEIWRVSLRSGFDAAPVRGVGAGGFELLWERDRPPGRPAVVDGHSLYLEVLGELGVVGLALLVLALGGMLVALARRTRGEGRHAWAALLATSLALLLHAGADWDWEMPAVMAWVFGAGALALAAAPTAAAGPARPAPGTTARVLAGLGCLALAVLPALVWRSQGHAVDAVEALRAGDCRAASLAALDATETLPVRSEPLEILAYCQVRRGRGTLARRSIEAAIARDPGNWELRYGQALIVGATGGDPRGPARSAVRRNPDAPAARALLRRLEAGERRTWRQTALSAPLPLPSEVP
jgi:hypothetical protein